MYAQDPGTLPHPFVGAVCLSRPHKIQLSCWCPRSTSTYTLFCKCVIFSLLHTKSPENNLAHDRTVSLGQKSSPGLAESPIRVSGYKEVISVAGCGHWQNSVPCARRTEVPTVWLAVSHGNFSGCRVPHPMTAFSGTLYHGSSLLKASRKGPVPLWRAFIGSLRPTQGKLPWIHSRSSWSEPWLQCRDPSPSPETNAVLGATSIMPTGPAHIQRRYYFGGHGRPQESGIWGTSLEFCLPE